MCREPSKFITPSSRFWKQGHPEKDRVTKAYKESMSRVPCRYVGNHHSCAFLFTSLVSYFQKSLEKDRSRPLCPFGRDCFYQHRYDDGAPYIFKSGTSTCMRVSHAQSSCPLTDQSRSNILRSCNHPGTRYSMNLSNSHLLQSVDGVFLTEWEYSQCHRLPTPTLWRIQWATVDREGFYKVNPVSASNSIFSGKLWTIWDLLFLFRMTPWHTH